MTARANYAANEPVSGLVPVQSLRCSQVTKHRVEEGGDPGSSLASLSGRI